jgi:proteic killer suppression protein
VRFKNAATRDLANGRDSKAARGLVPAVLRRLAQAKIVRLGAAPTLESLRVPPGNRLEAFRGSRTGQYSIRINDQFRICFVWEDGEAVDVEIVDYH